MNRIKYNTGGSKKRRGIDLRRSTRGARDQKCHYGHAKTNRNWIEKNKSGKKTQTTGKGPPTSTKWGTGRRKWDEKTEVGKTNRRNRTRTKRSQ